MMPELQSRRNRQNTKRCFSPRGVACSSSQVSTSVRPGPEHLLQRLRRVADHVEAAATRRAVDRERRDDDVPARHHRLEEDAPVGAPVALVDEEVEHRAVVPDLEAPPRTTPPSRRRPPIARPPARSPRRAFASARLRSDTSSTVTFEYPRSRRWSTSRDAPPPTSRMAASRPSTAVLDQTERGLRRVLVPRDLVEGPRRVDVIPVGRRDRSCSRCVHRAAPVDGGTRARARSAGYSAGVHASRVFDLPNPPRLVVDLQLLRARGGRRVGAVVVDPGMRSTAAEGALAQLRELDSRGPRGHGGEPRATPITSPACRSCAPASEPRRSCRRAARRTCEASAPARVRAPIDPLAPCPSTPSSPSPRRRCATSSPTGRASASASAAPFGSRTRPPASCGTALPLPGARGWEVLEVPGHTDDALCFYHRGSSTLVSGDAVLTLDGPAVVQPRARRPRRVPRERGARCAPSTCATCSPGTGCRSRGTSGAAPSRSAIRPRRPGCSAGRCARRVRALALSPHRPATSLAACGARAGSAPMDRVLLFLVRCAPSLASRSRSSCSAARSVTPGFRRGRTRASRIRRRRRPRGTSISSS